MKQYIFATFMLLGLAGKGYSHSNPDAAEALELESIARIIEAAMAKVDETENSSRSSKKINFRYDILRQDLTKILEGIHQYKNMPSIEPRKIEPIEGDYLN